MSVFKKEHSSSSLDPKQLQSHTNYLMPMDLSKKKQPSSVHTKALARDILFENSVTAMMLVDEYRTISVVNKCFCQLFGYTREELIGRTTSILSPDTKHLYAYRKDVKQTHNGVIQGQELQYRKKNGTLFWGKLTGTAIATEQKTFLLWSLDNITAEVESRQEMHNRYLELDLLFNRVPTGLLYVVDGIIKRANPPFLSIVDEKKEKVIGQSIYMFVPDFAQRRSSRKKQVVTLSKERGRISVEQEIEQLGENTYLVLFFNVTQHIQEKKALLSQASTDSLTKLLNRGAFQEQTKMLIARNQQATSFVIFDIDYFKKVNDTHGHDIGDVVLIELAQLLKQELRPTELVGRLGGEEFGIVLPVGQIQAINICKRLMEAVRKQLFTAKQLSITISLGLTDTRFSSDPEEMYREADRLLYDAKRLGRNRLEYCPR